jgi:hypothetical protein
MWYEIYTDEILKIHCSYYIEADSEDDAKQKFEQSLDNDYFSDTPMGDIYDSEIIGYEIYEY